MNSSWIKPLVMGLSVLLLADASVIAAPKARHKSTLAWPVPPEAPIYTYVYTLRSQADAGVVDSRNALKRLLTNAADSTRNVLLEKPVAVAARAGRILVADTSKQLVITFDIPRRRVYPFGVREDHGKLNKPVAIAIDQKGHSYVVDATTQRVNVYDDMGLYLFSVGSPATLDRPTGVAVDGSGESIYVVDRSTAEKNTPRVVRFDRKGIVRQIIGGPGSGPGEFNIPLRVAVDDAGAIFVLDSGNFRIQMFDQEGKFVRAFGVPGLDPGSFSRPRGLAVDKYVYVGDAAFGNVQIFDKTGRVLLVVGEMAKVAGDNYAGEYSLISDVAVDELGQIYIADQFSRKVEVIRRTGTPPDIGAVPDGTAQEGTSR